MPTLDNIKHLATVPVTEPHLKGLQSICKRFSASGEASVFHSVSKLDLDTDGPKNPAITHYDADHQDQTALDHRGLWLASDQICYIVLPGGFSYRHGGCKLGMLATVFYKNRMAHAVVADIGPKSKFGEGSLMLHGAIDQSRIRDGRVLNIGIDDSVEIVWYIGSSIGSGRFTQADIDKAAGELLNALIS